jgi:putative peptidoglycan lipid II flippase
VLTQATTLKPGSNTIEVNASSPTAYLVVWISAIATTDGENRTEISGLTVRAAS